MESNRAVIDRFIAAWTGMDVDRIMDFFAPDAVYTNVPIDPPNVGTAAIRAMIESFLGMAQGCEFVVHHCTSDEARGLVMNERTDRFHLANGNWIELPVMGVFELKDGRITAWRDYFDMGMFQKAMGG